MRVDNKESQCGLLESPTYVSKKAETIHAIFETPSRAMHLILLTSEE